MSGTDPGDVGVRRIASGAPWEGVVGYSRAVVVGDRVLVAGTTAVRGGEVVDGDAYTQTQAAFDVVASALAEAGTDLDHVVRSRMYVVGREHCDDVGRAHAQRLGTARPAATVVCVAGLVDPRLLVEVEVEAVLPGEPRA